MNKDLFKKTFRNTFLLAVYVIAVSQLMQNGDKWFGGNDAFAAPAILMLFVTSAAIAAGLVFGQSIFLFLDGKRKESLQAATYSIVWLLINTLIIFITLALVARF